MSLTSKVIQLCTVDMEIRELERLTINLVPETVFMESDTVLVQYIISRWSLQYRLQSHRENYESRMWFNYSLFSLQELQ